MKKINLNAKIGDEIELVNGSSTLVVKVGDGVIVPDFVDLLYFVVQSYSGEIMNAARQQFHRSARISPDQTRSVFAQIRDEIFASIKQENPTPEPTVTVKDDKQ